MIKGVSEFKEYMFSKTIMSLNHLGGTPAARAAAKAATKAAAKAKVKSQAAQSRRNSYLDAFSNILGGAPRRPIQSHDEIDDFLAKCEDPDYWKKITDRNTLRHS